MAQSGSYARRVPVVCPSCPLNVRRLVHVHSPNLADTLAAWQFTRVGLDYDLVAVFGSQSTGKSTTVLLAVPTGAASCH